MKNILLLVKKKRWFIPADQSTVFGAKELVQP